VTGQAAFAAAAAGDSAAGDEAEAAPGSWTCASAYLPVINDCATLRANFECTSCTDSIGADQPAMISLAAPADKKPGACLINADATLFDCGGKWTYAQRLCPCELRQE
jgi:hypothetical protein